MASGHGVIKPRNEGHPGRRVDANRWLGTGHEDVEGYIPRSDKSTSIMPPGLSSDRKGRPHRSMTSTGLDKPLMFGVGPTGPYRRR
jgi:hypothetical protein